MPPKAKAQDIQHILESPTVPKRTKSTKSTTTHKEQKTHEQSKQMFPEIKELSDKSFIFEPSLRLVDSDYKNKEIYIIFYSERCGACHQIEDKWDKSSQEKYAGLKLGKINVNNPKCKKIVSALDVSSIPLIKAIDWSIGDYGFFDS